VRRRPSAEPLADLSPVQIHHTTVFVEERKHHRADQVLVAARAENAESLQPGARREGLGRLALWHPVAEHAVGKTEAKHVASLGAANLSVVQIRLRLRARLERRLVVRHHRGEELVVAGLGSHERCELRRGWERSRGRGRNSGEGGKFPT
jgi:hypothetical protein